MNQLDRSVVRSSFRKLRSYTNSDRKDDEAPNNNNQEEVHIFFQTFSHHWSACQEEIRKYEPLSGSVQDAVLTVSAQLEQMCQLYQLEVCSSSSTTSILDLILSDNILGQLVSWTKSLPKHYTDELLILQTDLMTSLLNYEGPRGSLLSHQTLLRPIISLLDIFHTKHQEESDVGFVGGFSNGKDTRVPSNDKGGDQLKASNGNPANNLQKLEAAVLQLVYSLCLLLAKNPSLVDLFSSPSAHQPKLILFSVLTPYLHRPGMLGVQARDSLLLCISLSRKVPALQQFIADHSNFCPILATGLSGLFSLLPRSLDMMGPPASWHRLEETDAQLMPGLDLMLASLDICSAVLEVAPRIVEQQLVQLIDQGFLHPVLGPALVSESDQDAVVSSTAYLELFLRKVTAPSLLVTMLRFLCTASIDNSPIIDTLIQRINSSSQVCVVTLSLFETLLSFNIEDILVCLVFKHLVSGHFLIPSFRESLAFSDPQGRAAHKFLNLVPVSSDPPATPLTPRRLPASQSTSAGLASLTSSQAMQSHSQVSQTLSADAESINSSPARTNSRVEPPSVSLPPLLSSCEPPGSPRLPPGHANRFTEYLGDARNVIRTTVVDCLQWKHQYERVECYRSQKESTASRESQIVVSRRSSAHAQKIAKKMSGSGSLSVKTTDVSDDPLSAGGGCAPVASGNTLAVQVNIADNDNHGPSSLGGESSGYLSGNWESEPEEVVLSPEEEKEFWGAVSTTKEINQEKLSKVLFRLQHEDRLSLSSLGQESCGDSEPLLGTASPFSNSPRLADQPAASVDQPTGQIAPSQGQPSIGPFLTALLDKVEVFHENSLNLNLRLTGVISKLASFPQPLLRAVLTHPDIVLQPTCKTLFQVISTARTRIDSVMPSLLGAEEALRLARAYLADRVDLTYEVDSRRTSAVSLASLPAAIGDFGRKKGGRLFGILSNRSGNRQGMSTGKFSSQIPAHTHRYAMAAVLLEEWLHELAAIAREHSFLLHRAAILG